MSLTSNAGQSYRQKCCNVMDQHLRPSHLQRRCQRAMSIHAANIAAACQVAAGVTGRSFTLRTHGKCLMIRAMSSVKYPTDNPRAALDTWVCRLNGASFQGCSCDTPTALRLCQEQPQKHQPGITTLKCDHERGRCTIPQKQRGYLKRCLTTRSGMLQEQI